MALRFLALSLAVAIVGSCARPPSPAELADLRAQVKQAVERKPPEFAAKDGERGRQAWRDLRHFYETTDYHLAWSDGFHPRGSVDELARALSAADANGLDRADYGAPPAFDGTRAIDFDVRCTYVYLRYAMDLAGGTINPEAVSPQWHSARPAVHPDHALATAINGTGIEASLARLEPHSPQYQGLKHQLAQARGAHDDGRVQRIVMNMERWRWLPDDLGSRYILVNIPAFRLDVVENGRSVLGMRVVTGKKNNPTPVLADTIEEIVFSPYWNIPKDIVEKEILPHVADDPTYLERHNMEVDGDHYRQRPGRGNSLGQVKFVFPNHFNVYLHGTPSQSLFARVERDFSHGCVRVEHPLELARYVLRDQAEWTEARIVAAMNRGVEQAVRLKHPLPIYLVYFTAWEEGGQLRTVADVYGHDRRHAAAESS